MTRQAESRAPIAGVFWNEEMLPVQWETVKVTLKEVYKISRIYRTLAKMRGRGHLRRVTVFVRHENVVRLLSS